MDAFEDKCSQEYGKARTPLNLRRQGDGLCAVEGRGIEGISRPIATLRAGREKPQFLRGEKREERRHNLFGTDLRLTDIKKKGVHAKGWKTGTLALGKGSYEPKGEEKTQRYAPKRRRDLRCLDCPDWGKRFSGTPGPPPLGGIELPEYLESTENIKIQR